MGEDEGPVGHLFIDIRMTGWKDVFFFFGGETSLKRFDVNFGMVRDLFRSM